MNIKIALHKDDMAYMPVKAHPDDACYDLFARCYEAPDALGDERESVYLAPGGRCLAKTGVFIEMEPGWEALVRPRSGNSLKFGLTVLNTPGTIDAGYRNEVGVILHNAGQRMLQLDKGMKIAQVAFRKIPEHGIVRISQEDFDADTDRNLNGFGSTGL